MDYQLKESQGFGIIGLSLKPCANSGRKFGRLILREAQELVAGLRKVIWPGLRVKIPWNFRELFGHWHGLAGDWRPIGPSLFPLLGRMFRDPFKFLVTKAIGGPKFGERNFGTTVSTHKGGIERRFRPGTWGKTFLQKIFPRKFWSG